MFVCIIGHLVFLIHHTTISIISMAHVVRLSWSRCLMFRLQKRQISAGRSLLAHKDEPQQRMNNFFETRSEIVSKLNRDWAMPFFSLSEIIEERSVTNYEHLSTNSSLLSSVYLSQLHRPAIPMKYIMANTENVQENLRKRKLPAVDIDIEKDIIGPYKRLNEIRQEMESQEIKKDEITEDMKIFWARYNEEDTGAELPVEIKEKRQEAIDISCIIKLLSWIEAEIEKRFYEKALLIPNMSHPDTPVGDETAAQMLKTVNEKPQLKFPSVGHLEVGEKTGTILQSNRASLCGQRTYHLFREAADLEQALVQYTLDRLKSKGFDLISCPNILHGSAFEGCGVASTKMSDMLYHIDGEQETDYYIAGTSEVGIAAFFANHSIPIKHLPLKLCCVSTCNRKETNNRSDPRGLYRVHHFIKVEMFGVTANETGKESVELYHEFQNVQEELFKDLGLHFRIMNMPTGELGLPAYQKVDMEAWMSARKSYGEISSASNCTDFQSRRLHILYNKDGEHKFAHTINGTACAVPRLIIALLENNQSEDKRVELPQVLHPYLKNTTIYKSNKLALQYIGPNQSKKKRKMPKE